MRDYFFIMAHHGEQSKSKIKDLFDSISEGFETEADEPFIFEARGPSGRQDYYGLVYRAAHDEDVLLPLRVTECLMDGDEFISEAMAYECSPGDSDEPFVFYGDITTGDADMMISIPSDSEEGEAQYVSIPFRLGWKNEGVSADLSELAPKYIDVFRGQFKYINMIVHSMSAIGKLLI